MVVYVEAVIFDNFCLDYLLGYLTIRLSGAKSRRLFLALSAALGSAIALFFPLVPDRYRFVVKIATLFLSTAIFSCPCDFRRYMIHSFLYAILSFALCGILSFLLGADGRGLIGVSVGGAVGAISLATVFSLYAVRQIRGLIREKKRESKRAVAEVINEGKIVRLNVLFDSGNLLTDEKGEGVAVTDRRSLAALGSLPDLGEMRVRTASGSRVLPLVKLPEIKIYSERGENILTNVTAALSDLPDEYALILPCE